MFVQLTNGLNDTIYINDEHIDYISPAVSPPNEKCKSYIMFSSGTHSYYQETSDEIMEIIQFAREPKYAENKRSRW